MVRDKIDVVIVFRTRVTFMSKVGFSLYTCTLEYRAHVFPILKFFSLLFELYTIDYKGEGLAFKFHLYFWGGGNTHYNLILANIASYISC